MCAGTKRTISTGRFSSAGEAECGGRRIPFLPIAAALAFFLYFSCPFVTVYYLLEYCYSAQNPLGSPRPMMPMPCSSLLVCSGPLSVLEISDHQGLVFIAEPTSLPPYPTLSYRLVLSTPHSPPRLFLLPIVASNRLSQSHIISSVWGGILSLNSSC